MSAAIPDPQTLKQIIDYIGYSLMGLAGILSAWHRMRNAPFKPVTKETGGKHMPIERLEAVEREVDYLRTRQDQLQQESSSQQNAILKQQTAMFDLLVQQRSALDKILTKMGGLV